jgi:hypothetical protein
VAVEADSGGGVGVGRRNGGATRATPEDDAEATGLCVFFFYFPVVGMLLLRNSYSRRRRMEMRHISYCLYRCFSSYFYLS